AHVAYLLVLDLAALLVGFGLFLRWGVGPFSLTAFAGPYLVLTVPILVVVASLSVLFDVTPPLSRRGGLVAWFFVFLFGLVMLPMQLAGNLADDGRPNPQRGAEQPVFDPVGMATDVWLVRQSLPEGATDVSAGHVSFEHTKIERVPWRGVPLTPRRL